MNTAEMDDDDDGQQRHRDHNDPPPPPPPRRQQDNQQQERGGRRHSHSRHDLAAARAPTSAATLVASAAASPTPPPAAPEAVGSRSIARRRPGDHRPDGDDGGDGHRKGQQKIQLSQERKRKMGPNEGGGDDGGEGGGGPTGIGGCGPGNNGRAATTKGAAPAPAFAGASAPPPPTVGDDGEEATDSPPSVSVSPHVMRLLRLVRADDDVGSPTSPSSRSRRRTDDRTDYARHAARQLGEITSQTSPLILWDILGRLSGYLCSANWRCRENAALAMGCVARNLPVEDQRDFLMGDHVVAEVDGSEDENDDSERVGDGRRRRAGFLWLTPSDLLQPEGKEEKDGESKDDHSNGGGATEGADVMLAKGAIAAAVSSSSSEGAGGGGAASSSTRIGLDAVLRGGRLLLSRHEEDYDDQDDEEEALRMLDEAAVAGGGGKEAAAGDSSLSSFLERRVAHQRRIMARRLGLYLHGGEGLNSSSMSSFAANDFVSDQLLSSGRAGGGAGPPPSSSFVGELLADDDGCGAPAARKKKRRRLSRRERGGEGHGRGRKKGGAGNDRGVDAEEEGGGEEDAASTTMRALLVLEMRRGGSIAIAATEATTSSSQSHRRPQTLLATDLLYRTTDPRWEVRHGALLGVTALLRSWWRCGGAHPVGAFGRWPLDISARCICVLALDRFGDFGSGGAGGGSGSEAVVAPVREAAARLLALQLAAAPPGVRGEAWKLIRRMASPSTTTSGAWEVRHGSMLAIKYVSAAAASASASASASAMAGRTPSVAGPGLFAAGCEDGAEEDAAPVGWGWREVADVAASTGLADPSDDVRGVSAQVLSCMLRAWSRTWSDGEEEGDGDGEQHARRGRRRRYLIRSAVPRLWAAIVGDDDDDEEDSPGGRGGSDGAAGFAASSFVVSSCLSDLLSILADALEVDAELTLRSLFPSTREEGTTPHPDGKAVISAAASTRSTPPDDTEDDENDLDEQLVRRCATVDAAGALIGRLLRFLDRGGVDDGGGGGDASRHRYYSASVRSSCHRALRRAVAPLGAALLVPRRRHEEEEEGGVGDGRVAVPHGTSSPPGTKGDLVGAATISTGADAEAALWARGMGPYCDLLRYVFSAFLEEDGDGDGDGCGGISSSGGGPVAALDCWGALLDNFPPLPTPPPSAAPSNGAGATAARNGGDGDGALAAWEECHRLVSSTFVDLILRYVGIERRRTTIPRLPASRPRPPALRRLTAAGDDATLFARRVVAADALARLSHRLVDPLPKVEPQEEDGGSAACSGALSPVMGTLVVAVEALLSSPWTSHCEAGCLLVGALSNRRPGDGGVSGAMAKTSPLRGATERIQALLIGMLDGSGDVGDSSPPFCLEVDACPELARIRDGDPDIAVVCDEAFVSLLDGNSTWSPTKQPGVVFAHDGGRDAGSCLSAQGVIALWKRMFYATGQQQQRGKTPPTLNSMRVYACISGAIVAQGSSARGRHADAPALPPRLTPLIRSLMTSLRNEKSIHRVDHTCRSISRLVLLLAGAGDGGKDENARRMGKVRVKLLDNVCALACENFGAVVGDGSNGGETTSPTGPTAGGAERVLRMLVTAVRDSDRLLEIALEPLFGRIAPMSSADPMAASGQSLNHALHLLRVVTGSLRDDVSQQPGATGTTLLTGVIRSFLRTTAAVACTSPSLWARQCALFSATDMCVADPFRAFPLIIPIIFGFMRELKGDARRLGGWKLLRSIVEELGVYVCPFVVCLLPAVMSGMTDHVVECSRIAAAVFASLVRVAPLVRDDDDHHNVVDAIPSTDEVDEKERSHGSVALGRNVSNAGKKRRPCSSANIDAFKTLPNLPTYNHHGSGSGGSAASADTDRESSEKIMAHLIHGRPLPPCDMPPQLCAAMEGNGITLRRYQVEGISWIRFLASVNLNGALCDEMGLGKTLQALTSVGIAHCHHPNAKPNAGTDQSNIVFRGPVSLVVCPSTVVGHWMNEILRFFPDGKFFRALQYSGSKRKRRELWGERYLQRCNIVVTSYAILRNDVDTLSEQDWVYCILDEGHLLKNPKTASAMAARRLRCKHKLILTGTPVQNRVKELWAVFDFLMPNFLGSENSFSKKFVKPILAGHLPDASAESVGDGMERLKSLHQQVLPFILRREKTQVLKELPPKIITDIPCPLGPEQSSMYLACSRNSETRLALERIKNSTENNDKLNGKFANERVLGGALKSLLLLRLICTHPVLAVSRLKGNTQRKEEEKEGKGTDDIGENATSRDIMHEICNFARFDCSGKLAVLNDLLRNSGVCKSEMTAADNDCSSMYVAGNDEGDSDENHIDMDDIDIENNENNHTGEWSRRMPASVSSKCLIFAQFAASLDVVEQLLFRPHMPSLRYLRLDGRVPLDKRGEIVDRFNNDEGIRVLLLTTRVGGLGLNLTGADMVILLEHDWNPHTDIQACDRAHRIGQEKTVNVYRLVTVGTIEEKIMKLQEAKLNMSDAIVNTENSTMYSMGTERLLDLFTLNVDEGLNDGNVSNHDEGFFSGSGKHMQSTLPDHEDACWYDDEEYSALNVQGFVSGVLGG